jgi:hypothetical protein
VILVVKWLSVSEDKGEYGIIWMLTSGCRIKKDELGDWVFHSFGKRKIDKRSYEPIVVVKGEKKSELEGILDKLEFTDLSEADEKAKEYNLGKDARVGFKLDGITYLNC